MPPPIVELSRRLAPGISKVHPAIRMQGLNEQHPEEVVTGSNLTAPDCLQCLLVPDHLQSVCRFLTLPDVANLALACRLSATSVNSHNELWAQLCVDWMGVKAPLPNEV